MFRLGGRSLHAWSVAALTLLAGLIVTLAAGVLSGIFSRGLVLDVASLWPGALLAAGVWVYQKIRRPRRLRSTALPPLLLLTWLILAAAAHLTGWADLPSSSAELTGPSVGDLELAALSAALDGSLEVGPVAAEEPLYQVGFFRLGGEVGVPSAEETPGAEALEVVITDRGANPWFRYAGWTLGLNPLPEWRLELTGNVTADLRDLKLGELAVVGEGSIQLGQPAGAATVTLDGDFEVLLPTDVPATAVGVASVPAGWLPTDTGYRSPTADDGWQITASGEGSVVIFQP